MRTGPWLLAVTLLLAYFPAVYGGPLYVLHPKPGEGYEVKGDKVYFRHGNAGLILECGSDASIAKYYSDRGIEMGNPFIPIGGDSQGYAIFILTILNRTNGSVTFTSRYVTARVKDQAYFPMDFTSLLAFMEGMDPSRQKVLQNSIFHSPEMIPSNKIVTKLLIFPALPKKLDRLKLEFDYLYFEDSEIRLKALFTE